MTNATVSEGKVRISKDIFNQGFRDFIVANGAGTYSMGTEADASV